MDAILKSKYFYKILLAFILTVVVVFKLVIAIPVEGPVVLGDEAVYRDCAHGIYENFSYTGYIVHPTHSWRYPPLYPFLLSPAFIDEANFYFWFKILNVIFSSMLIIPAWLLARYFFDEKLSLLCTLLIMLLPYNYLWPQLIMTENIYLPIFTFTIYAILQSSKKLNFKWAAITGVFLCLLYLARQISLMLFPFFILLWLLNSNAYYEKFFNLNLIFKRIKIIGVILLFYIITLSPWIYTGIHYKWHYSQIVFGLFSFGVKQIERSRNLAGLTDPLIDAVKHLDYFPLFIYLYLFYFILMLAPMLSTIFCFPYAFKIKKLLKEPKAIFFIFTVIISFALILLSAKYSATNDYNYPIPGYLLGRYMFMIILPWAICFVIVWESFKNLAFTKKNLIYFIISAILSSALIIISYKGIITGEIWKLSPWFILWFNCFDAYHFLNSKVLYMALIITLLPLIILFLRKNKKIIFGLTAAILIIYYIIALSTAHSLIKRDFTNESKAIAYLLIDYLDKNPQKESYRLLNNTGIPNDFLYFSLVFWGVDISKTPLNISLKPVKMIIHDEKFKNPISSDRFKPFYFSVDSNNIAYNIELDIEKFPVRNYENKSFTCFINWLDNEGKTLKVSKIPFQFSPDKKIEVNVLSYIIDYPKSAKQGVVNFDNDLSDIFLLKRIIVNCVIPEEQKNIKMILTRRFLDKNELNWFNIGDQVFNIYEIKN